MFWISSRLRRDIFYKTGFNQISDKSFSIFRMNFGKSEVPNIKQGVLFMGKLNKVGVFTNYFDKTRYLRSYILWPFFKKKYFSNIGFMFF